MVRADNRHIGSPTLPILITKGDPPALPGRQQKFDSSGGHAPGFHRRDFEREPPSTQTKFRRWTAVRAPEQIDDRRKIRRGTGPEKNPEPEPAPRHAAIGPCCRRWPPSGGSSIGDAQRPRCRFERPQT